MKLQKPLFYFLFSLAYSLVLVIISISISYQWISAEIGILPYSGILLLLFILYLFLFFIPSKYFQEFLYYFLFVGILCRIVLSVSMPLWEDDWARYLWEGNLVRLGISPYATPPEYFFTDFSHLVFGDKEMEILSRINHPDWSAIYSPLVLLYFYICAILKPMSLTVLKMGYIGMDLLVVWMISCLRNKKSAVLYFLFPVLLKEVYINSHFEMISIFLCIASIYFQKKSHINYSSFFYGLAVHSKLYLLIIFPFFLIRNTIDFKNQKIIRKAIFPFIAYFLIGIALPVVIFELVVQNNSVYGLDSLLKFTNEFEFNSIYFYLLKLLFNFETAKKLVLILLSIVSIYSVLKYEKYFVNFNNGIVWCYTVFLFSLLFSPIVNPWYFLVVVPLYFITNIRLPNILLIVLLPQLSYLTKVNLKLEENLYRGFYTIEESIVPLEIVCITITILLTILSRKKKPSAKSNG